MSFKLFLAMFIVPVLMVVIYYDYRWRRIPNFITIPLVIVGMLFQMMQWGGIGFQRSLAGFVIGSGVFFILYLFGGMGAGDVKLMGGVGALLGTDSIFIALVLIIFIGGFMAIVKIMKRVISSEGDGTPVFKRWFNRQQRLSDNQANGLSQSETIPYGIAISIGTLLTILLF